MNSKLLISNFLRKLTQNGEVYIQLKIRPGASSNEFKTLMDNDTLKVNITALPVGGKANTELIKFLAKEFSTKKEYIKILSGAGSRTKLIKITNKNNKI